MILAMTDLHTLISAVNAHMVNQNEVRFGGKSRLQVKRFKGAGIGGVFSEMPNDFCVFIDTPDNPGPHAIRLFVKLEEGVLRCTLRLSDEIKDFRRDRELPSLPMSLDADQIAQQLVASVLAETRPQ